MALNFLRTLTRSFVSGHVLGGVIVTRIRLHNYASLYSNIRLLNFFWEASFWSKPIVHCPLG